MKNISNAQQRHESIINFLNSQPHLWGAFNKSDTQTSYDNLPSLDPQDIVKAVTIVVDVLNINGGSLGDMDLYKLLKVYILQPEQREEINKLIAYKG